MRTIGYNSVPNMLSYVRLLLAIILWIPALLDMPFYVGAGLVLAGLTDLLDGYAARRWGAVTEYGRRLDSMADTSIVVSAVFWVILVEPAVFFDNKLLVSSWMLTGTASFAVGLIKFRKIPDLHLYMTKASSVAGYVFITYMFIVGYNETLFHVASVFLLISSFETLLLQLLSPRTDGRMKSILYAYRQGRGSSGTYFS